MGEFYKRQEYIILNHLLILENAMFIFSEKLWDNTGPPYWRIAMNF